MVGASLRGMPASYNQRSERVVSVEMFGGASYLQLSERETTASAHAAVVLDGRVADDRPQLVDWARRKLGSLLDAGIASAGLATRL